MHFVRRAQFVLLLLVIPAISYAADSAATQSLHQLFDQDWEYQMAHDPVGASELGDRRWNDQWENLSLGSLREQFQHAREMLTGCTPSPRPAFLAEQVSSRRLRVQHRRLPRE